MSEKPHPSAGRLESLRHELRNDIRDARTWLRRLDEELDRTPLDVMPGFVLKAFEDASANISYLTGMFNGVLMAEFSSLQVEEALPKNRYRLAHLKDPDAQLHRLLDFFERNLQLPMGSDDWADRAINVIRRLINLADAATQLRSDLRDSRLSAPELERFEAQAKHTRDMYRKFLPPIRTHCDWCGWPEPDVQLAGSGMAACADCRPKDQTDNQDEQQT